MTRAPAAPAIVRKSAAAKKAWREIWKHLNAAGMAHDLYAPTVAIWAVEMGLASEAADAIFRPIDPETGERRNQTLEQYLCGRNSQTAQELTLLREALKHAGSLADKFGTSPKAAHSIGASANKQKEESPMMQYIRAANERRKKVAL